MASSFHLCFIILFIMDILKQTNIWISNNQNVLANNNIVEEAFRRLSPPELREQTKYLNDLIF